MPLYSSHLLQHFDVNIFTVSIFAVIKQVYSQAIQSELRSGLHSIDKLKVLEIYPLARNTVYRKVSTISNSFATTGIKPFNLHRALDKLDIHFSSSPTTLLPSQWQPETPVKPHYLHQQVASINISLHKRFCSPPSSD